jgi:hypothetical protein
MRWIGHPLPQPFMKQNYVLPIGRHSHLVAPPVLHYSTDIISQLVSPNFTSIIEPESVFAIVQPKMSAPSPYNVPPVNPQNASQPPPTPDLRISGKYAQNILRHNNLRLMYTNKMFLQTVPHIGHDRVLQFHCF